MSDFMFMLENHLSSDQNRVVAEVQAAAALANVNLFLTGGTLRDMLGGFQIRDLDFSVEGQALKLAKTLVDKSGAQIVASDENRKTAELLFPGGVTAQLGMARQERYARTGARPQVTPATIQEDLRGRDFSVNAIALSLNRASRGLLLDPTNGLADLERRELRALSAYTFYDDPSRLLRLVRLRVRLGFAVEERTHGHFEAARQADVQQHIPPRARFDELRRIAAEPAPGEVLTALEQAGLTAVFSPTLEGAKLNLPAITRLDKVARLLPPELSHPSDRLGPFLYALMEKLSQRERAAVIKGLEMTRAEIDLFEKLESRARKVEQALKSARIRKPSQVYAILSRAPGDEILFLLYHSPLKVVQERVRAYLQKYLGMVQEIDSSAFASIQAAPGTPKHEKAREEIVARHLDHRPRKKPEEPPPPPAVEPPARGRGRPPVAPPSVPGSALARRSE